MEYTIKSGKLYRNNNRQSLTPLVTVKKPSFTTKKTFIANNEEYYTNIKLLKTECNINDSEYVLYDKSKNYIANAKPKYAQNNNTDSHGWPLSHAPRVNHASVSIKGIPYTLLMLNNLNYRLVRQDSSAAIEIIHNGIGGGWTVNVENETEFEPIILIGVFFFCRYLEKENEFVVV